MTLSPMFYFLKNPYLYMDNLYDNHEIRSIQTSNYSSSYTQVGVEDWLELKDDQLLLTKSCHSFFFGCKVTAKMLMLS